MVIPGRVEDANPDVHCTSENLEIPGLVPSDHPGKTAYQAVDLIQQKGPGKTGAFDLGKRDRSNQRE